VARSNSKRGFVLIEVLVAVAVAGILLVIIVRSFVNTWYGIGVVREEAEAALIARSLINAVAPRENLSEVSQQGNVGRYRWAMEIKKVPLAPANAADSEGNFSWSLYRIGIAVTEPNGRRLRIETSRLSKP
jgi:prepilin-type N-terminal cleavage/methylation domain-containing protein